MPSKLTRSAGVLRVASAATGRPAVPVSVIVPVKNEAENLRRCLPALAWADEVFVVDSQSTDDTARGRRASMARPSSSSTSTGPTPRRRTGRSTTSRSATSGS